MNPENPPTPREEIEMRLTALLLGELPPEETAAIQAQMATDPELAALHERLRKAMELLREATTLPEQDTPPAPVQLSSERRERLLAHFKTAVPAPATTPIVKKPRRDWSWAVPLSLAAAVIVAVGAGLLMPLYSDVRVKSRSASRWAFTPESDKDTSPLFRLKVSGPISYRGYAETSTASGPALSTPAPQQPQINTALIASNSGNTVAVPQLADINITGNTRTMGKAIRREVPQRETSFLLGAERPANAAIPPAKIPPPLNLGKVEVANTSETTLGFQLQDRSLPEDQKRPFATDVNGTGGVTLNGGGTLTLTGSNTYAGATTVNGGTLSVGGASGTTFGGAITGNTRTNDKVIRREFPVQLDDVFNTGSGGVTKTGSGTLTLGETATTAGNGTLETGTEKAPHTATLAFGDAKVTVPIKDNAEKNVFMGGGTIGHPVESQAAGSNKGLPEVQVFSLYKGAAGSAGPATASPAQSAETDYSKTQKPTTQLLTEAQGLYDTGRLALAKKRTEQILSSDPNNQAARDFEKKIDRSLSDYGVSAYNETRADIIPETDMAWARPISKPKTAVEIQQNNLKELDFDWLKNDTGPVDTQLIRRKLDRIIIPKLELREATIGEALDFLKKKSAELDNASPAGLKGTNIVLKSESQPATPKAVTSTAAANPADARITVSLSNIPLGEALKYVTGLANMKYKVEPHAISVVPATENTDVFATKEWKVPPDLIPRTAGASGTGIADRQSAKNWLIANGVQFNGAASAIYIVKSSRLIVRNTQDQLDLVDTIIETEEKTKAEEAPKAVASSALIPQPEIKTSANAFSTFSLNVSDVSFKLAEASLQQGRMPDPTTVRSEEFINAFDYRDPEPAPGVPLAFAAERARYPFAQNRDLLRFSVKTAAAGRQADRPLNIVLLLDKSGSMERADRLNIVREALRILAAQLQPQDKLSIVTFARTPRLWADGVAGDKAGEMIARVGEITPEGGTNLEAALDLGYATAQRHYAPASINRVVLFTDGAANLGDVDPDALTKKVEAHRKQGVTLDCFGIGWEGYNDDLLEQLTRHGDGRYGFINTPDEAAANFAAQLAGALQVAASDVKVQVDFNPKRVTAYRQIGYAKHQLTKEQFRDNSVAAAQIGAAESGNALYVVEVDPRGEGDLATVRVRFRVPGTSDYREHEWTVPFSGNVPPLEQASSALRLAGTASAFSEMLAASPYATAVASDRLLGVLEGVPAIFGADPRPKQLEWMIRQARSLSGR